MSDVSCIIPAYNEAERVGAVVRAARLCPGVHEIIVVSDGSTDGTPSAAAWAGADRVLVLRRNHGKGGAVLEAAAVAQGDVFLVLDADLRGLQPAHLEGLLAPVLSGQADMSIGLFPEDRWHGLLPQLSGQRAFRRTLLQGAPALAATGFGFELALDRLARRKTARVTQVPLEGVRHLRKHQKYGAVGGLRQEIRASAEVLRQGGIPLLLVQASASWRERRPITTALVASCLILALVSPALLTKPSNAGHLPGLPPLRTGDRLLLVVAHPDDEIIGAGGLVTMARRAGVPVYVLVLTYGDSNRLSAALVGRHLRPRPDDFIRAGLVRRREAVQGLHALGVDTKHTFFLGFPDRGLAPVLAGDVPFRSPFTHLDQADYVGVVEPGAMYARSVLRALVGRIVAEVAPTIIITHAPFDRHPDHQAAYSLVSPLRGRARLVTFLVHASGFPRPLRSAPKQPLLPPTTLELPAGWSWTVLNLPPEVASAKQEALRAHRSQIDTPYLRFLLASFVRANELFAVPVDSRVPSE